jgi:ABC-2 type transport system permease protein
MSYEVDALRGLLIGTPSNLPLDAAVLVVAFCVALIVASRLLDRLAR